MAYVNARRKVLLLLFAFMVLFAFASMDEQWIGWVRAATQNQGRGSSASG
jgi:hypothetical protein